MNIVSPRFAHIIVLFFTGLSTSGTEPGVTHNRRVSDALHHHRIFDTMMMSSHPLIPRPSHLYTSYQKRLPDGIRQPLEVYEIFIFLIQSHTEHNMHPMQRLKLYSKF